MTTETMTIQEACAAIDYTPADGFSDKPEKEQWAMIRAKRIERARRDAVAKLGELVGTDYFSALPEEFQEAIRTVAVKRTGGGGGGARKNVFMDTLRGHLVNAGDQVDELELFRALKMGRGEIRAKIRENLKNAEPKNRFWVELDEDAEAWVLLGTGKKQPKGWKGAPIDEA